MTRKTGKVALKARQQVRAAKQAMEKRELAEAGVSLSVPRPSAKSVREKEEELRKLYLELFTSKEETQEAKPPETPEANPPEEKPPEQLEQPQQQKEKKPEAQAQESKEQTE